MKRLLAACLWLACAGLTVSAAGQTKTSSTASQKAARQTPTSSTAGQKAAPSAAVPVPASNAANLQVAPARPGLGDANERAQLLLEAIRANDPERARSFFLPREAFRAIKASGNPDALYDRLWRAYERDIQALHQMLAKHEQVSFVRLDLSRRREWVRPGGEANRLPYWAQRHNTLLLRVGRERQTELPVEVRVMISWDNRWYITHLSEFRATKSAAH